MLAILVACGQVPLAQEAAMPLPAAHSKPQHSYSRLGNPPYYEVAGKRYTLLPQAAGYRATGVASWYGPGFHGEMTSSGEPYDMNAMTAAHKTLPIPTRVRVTRTDTGASVVVRVNDRGPFVDGRIIDLSRAAAVRLDMLRQGTAPVLVEALESPDSVASLHGRRVYIQAGAYGEKGNALRRQSRLQTLLAEKKMKVRLFSTDRDIYRVRIGPFSRAEQALRMQGYLEQQGIDGLRILSE